MVEVNLERACGQHLVSTCMQMYPKDRFRRAVAEAICKFNKDLYERVSRGNVWPELRDAVAWATRIFEKFTPPDICLKIKEPAPAPVAEEKMEEPEPVNRRVPIEVPLGILLLAGLLALADGPLPVGDAAAVSLLTAYGVSE